MTLGVFDVLDTATVTHQLSQRRPRRRYTHRTPGPSGRGLFFAFTAAYQTVAIGLSLDKQFNAIDYKIRAF